MPSTTSSGVRIRLRTTGAGVSVAGAERHVLRPAVPGIHDPQAAQAAGWDWDGETLRVRADPYGALPLYYRLHDDGIAVADGIAALAAGADLDRTALAAFLRLGYFLGTDTPLRGVHTLPPRGVLRWSAGRHELTGGRPALEPRQLSFDAAVDGFVERFRAAVALGLDDEPVALPLTGGYDSRLVLCELDRIGKPPAECLTVGHANDHDALVATRAAELFGVPQRLLSLPGDWLAHLERRNRLTEFGSDEHTYLLPLADHILGRYRHAFDGIGVDIYTKWRLWNVREWTARYDAGDLDGLPDVYFAQFGLPEPFRSQLERHWLGIDDGQDRARGRFLEVLANFAEDPNPIAAFNFWNRTCREIALHPFGLLRDVPVMHCPHLHPDVFAFVAALPPSLPFEANFRAAVVKRSYPKAAVLDEETPHAAAPRRSRLRGLRTLLRRAQHAGPRWWPLLGRSLADSAARRRNGADWLVYARQLDRLRAP